MLSYGYDPSGRIKTLSWNAGGKTDTATYDYVDNSHLLSGMKTGSGLTTSYTDEDHRNVKTSVSNSFGNTAVSTYTYEYDELGRRKSVKNSGSAFNNPNFNIYGYNDRSEVTASSSFTGEDLANKNNALSDLSRAYNYDPIGNRKTASEAANNFSYTANSLNQYESIPGGANPETPAYDLDGNMTVSKGMVYTYNAENRLIEAAPQNPQQGSVKSAYIYDYMGRRAQKTLYTYSSGSWQKQKDISFIYDGWNMVKELEKTSDSSPEVPTYYVWGLDLSQSMQGAGGVGGLIANVKAGNEYLYFFDANGNVGQMVNSTDGSIAAKYEYDPFGKAIFSEGPLAGENPYRFSTKYQDGETGFYYYGYRYYDVEIGRWINRDSLQERGGINIYASNRNDCLNRVDYLGMVSNPDCQIFKDRFFEARGEYVWAEREIDWLVEYARRAYMPNFDLNYKLEDVNAMKKGSVYDDPSLAIYQRDFEKLFAEIGYKTFERNRAAYDMKVYMHEYNQCLQCTEKGFYCSIGSSAIGMSLDAVSIALTVTGAGMPEGAALFALSSANNLITAYCCREYEGAYESQKLTSIGMIASLKSASTILGPYASAAISVGSSVRDIQITLRGMEK